MPPSGYITHTVSAPSLHGKTVRQTQKHLSHQNKLGLILVLLGTWSLFPVSCFLLPVCGAEPLGVTELLFCFLNLLPVARS